MERKVTPRSRCLTNGGHDIREKIEVVEKTMMKFVNCRNSMTENANFQRLQLEQKLSELTMKIRGKSESKMRVRTVWFLPISRTPHAQI